MKQPFGKWDLLQDKSAGDQIHSFTYSLVPSTNIPWLPPDGLWVSTDLCSCSNPALCIFCVKLCCMYTHQTIHFGESDFCNFFYCEQPTCPFSACTRVAVHASSSGLYNCGPALCLCPLTESCCRLSRLTGLMSTPARDVLGFLRVSLVSSIIFSFPLLQMN